MNANETAKYAVVLVLGGLLCAPVNANPKGGEVVAGGAGIVGEGTSHVTVTQTTDRAIINWESFSIGAGGRTDFLQPSASAVTLNRVVGADPSNILGTLTATGRIVLVNRNGIVFGESASVDAAGLVATTHDVDDGQFMRGGPLRFNDGGKAGASVVNQGTISIRDAGLAAFVAPHVRNSGIIQANLGTVELASASGFTLDFYGDRLISFEIDDELAETLTTVDGTPLKALLANEGTIDAAGGRIYLTAAAAREVVNESLNLSGVVRADSVTQDGGVIVLSGSGTVAVEAGAVVSASGVSGGRIDVTGREVAIEGATISATGAEQGGLVRLGGAFQGGKTSDTSKSYHESFVGRWGALPAIAEAERVAIDAAASIDVSSSAGAGGTAVVWSSDETTFRGSVDARGVSSGGSVELSAANQLQHLDLTSVRIGRGGHLLLDPKNITIGATGDATPVSEDYEAGDNPDADVAVLATGLANQLNNGTSVTLQATNDIAVTAAVDASSGGGDLTLQAGNNIIISADVTTVGAQTYDAGNNVAVNANADLEVTGKETLSIKAGSQIVLLQNATVKNSYAGADGEFEAIELEANNDGVDFDVSGASNAGIYLEKTSLIQAAGQGGISLYGKSGLATGTGINGIGVQINTATIKADSGNISITGIGKDGPGTTPRYGVLIQDVISGADLYDGGSLIETNNGSITVWGQGGARIGASGVQSNFGVAVIQGSRIESKGSGSIEIEGYGGGPSNGYGVAIYGVVVSSTLYPTVLQTDTGNIEIKGTGTEGTGTENTGVYIARGARVESSDGSIKIEGTGGGENSGYGVAILGEVSGGAVYAPAVQTETGNIEITGTASVDGTGTGNRGVYVAIEALVASASGDIEITGVGGTSGLNQNDGVYVSGGRVETHDGDILLDGKAGGTGENNYGVRISHNLSGGKFTYPRVIAGGDGENRTGIGTITITGVGGGSTNGTGVYITNGALVQSALGSIDIEGTGTDSSTGSEHRGVAILNSLTDFDTVVESVDGDISITGYGGANTTGEKAYGVEVSTADSVEEPTVAVRTIGTGSIAITGTGGGKEGATDAMGVRVKKAHVQSASGEIDITGTAGVNATGANARGVSIVTGAAIESEDGDIFITGFGGESATGSDAYGVQLQSASVESTGDASITITGTGGGGEGADYAIGVRLAQGALVLSGDSGDIEIAGTGGPNATGDYNRGVYTEAGAEVVSAGTGDIRIIGIGGEAGGSGNYGAYLFGSVQGLGSGDVLIQGTGGGVSDNNHGLYFNGDAEIKSTDGRIALVSQRGAGSNSIHFRNDVGAGLMLDGSVWAAYLPEPDHNTYGSLESGNLPIWAATIDDLSPADATTDGNRYVFAHSPLLTVSTSFNDSKTYGDVYTFPAPVLGTHYQLGSLVNAASYGGVWTQETLEDIGLSGAPALASAGTAATASVAGGPYDITIAKGTLANTAGYTFDGFTSTGSLTVTRRTLTVDDVVGKSRVYDGTREAELEFSTDDIVNDDDVSFGYEALFADKNVANGKAITVTDDAVTLTGEGASNYTLSLDLDLLDGLTANITPATLVLGGSFTADNKVYDAATVAALNTTNLNIASGKFGDDAVSILGSGATGQFADKNVGDDKVVTLAADGSGVLTGTDAVNYVIDASGLAAVTANITPATLVLDGSFTASNKTYDATTDAQIDAGALGIASGLFDGDVVTILTSGATGAFADKNVGEAKAVTLATNGAGVLTGTDASNYVIDVSGLAAVTANITPATLVLEGSFTASNKTYDATTAAPIDAGGLGIASGLFDGDVVTILTSGAAGVFADKNVGDGKAVTLAANGSGVLTGTDAGNYVIDASGLEAVTANITPATLVLGGSFTASNKTYDATTEAQIASGGLSITSGLFDGDVVTILTSGAAGMFADKNVGEGKAVALATNGNGVLTGTDAGNYVIDASGLAAVTANITPATLVLDGSFTASNKTYDATTKAEIDASGLGIASGVLADDVVTILTSGATGVFADKNVGDGKAVTLTAAGVLTGDDAGNYVVDTTGLDAVMANITPATLVLGGSFTASNKTYDATTQAQVDAGGLSIASGLFDGDVVTILTSGATGAFANKNVGENKAVTLAESGTGVLTGTDAGNYVVDTSGLAAVTANITPATLVLGGTFTASNKTYDTTTEAQIDAGALSIASGLFDGDAVTILSSGATGAFADKNVGENKAVTLAESGAGVLTGTDAGNYVVDTSGLAAVTANITPATLVLDGSFTASNKTYDATTAAQIDAGGLGIASGLFDGDVVTILASGATGVFADKNVGEDKAVTLTAAGVLTGTDAGNYVIDASGLEAVTANITPATLVLSGSFTASNKTYDATTQAQVAAGGLGIASGLFDGDVVTILTSGATGVFADKNVGENKAVTLVSDGSGVLDGADAGNYVIDASGLAAVTANITPATLVLGGSFTASNKTYDATTAAQIDAGGLSIASGLFDGDVVTILTSGATGVFADKNVGEDKAVSLTAAGVLTGGDAGNYVVDTTGLDAVTADITPATLVLGGSFTASNKTYDATTAAPIDAGGLSIASGVLDDDVVTILTSGATGVFADKNVGQGKTVTLTADGSGVLTGTDAGNYVIDASGLDAVTANVTPATLVLGGSFAANDKTYDATTVAQIDAGGVSIASGLFDGDVVSILSSGATGVFANKNVGQGKAVTLAADGSGVLTGTDAGNYVIDASGLAAATANVTPATLVLGGSFTASNKTYDASTVAQIDTDELGIASGLLDGDVVTILTSGATGAFADKHVGQGKAVTLAANGSGVLTGTDAGNYVADTSGLAAVTANITARPITVTAQTDSRAYDGTTASSVAPQITAGSLADGDTWAALSQQFDTRHAGTGKTLSAIGLVADGNGGANYAVTWVNATGTITPATLVLGGSFTVAATKDYDGTAIAELLTNGLTLDLLHADDEVVLNAVATYGDKHVGTGKTVTLTSSTLGGAEAGNYNLVFTGAPTTTASIAARPITVTAQTDSRVYDGTTGSSAAPQITSGSLVDGDAWASLSQSFDTKHVGTGKTLTAAGQIADGNGGANYAVTWVSATGTITPATLVVGGSFTADNKVYDATTLAQLDAGLLTLEGIVGGDDVIVRADATGQFGDKNVGAGKTVTLAADGRGVLGGADAGNYVLDISGLAAVTANITPATLVVGGSFTAEDKVYDATTLAQIDAALLTLNGILGGDDVTVRADATGSFASKNAGAGNAVTLAANGSGVLSGADAGNYVLDTSGLAPVTADITPAKVTITGTFAVAGKVYDGTTDATITANDLGLAGVYGDDAVDLNAVVAFLDKSAGAGKLAGLDGSSLGGLDAANYAIDFADAPTATGSIAQRTITVTAEAQTKVYGDGDPMLRFVVGGLGLGAGDTLADVFDGALQRAAGENVGAYAIGRGDLAANANYEIAAFTGADLTITPATLIVSVDDQVRRQGEPNPSFTYVVDGFKFADDASVISGLTVGTSADADSPAGAYAIVASGASAANYVFEYIDGILKVVPAGVDSNIRDLSNQQLVLLGQRQAPASDSLFAGSGSPTIGVSVTEDGLVATPSTDRTFGDNGGAQAAIAGTGAVASCTAGATERSVVANIVNVGTDSGVYCTSSVLPGIAQ